MSWKKIPLLKDLANFLACKWLRCVGLLNYPPEILPKKTYRLRINIPNLLQDKDVIVLRRSDFDLDNTFDELGNVREDAITLERVPRLSMNFLGTFFLIEHAKFKVDKDGSTEWAGEQIYLYDFLNRIAKPLFVPPYFFKGPTYMAHQFQ